MRKTASLTVACLFLAALLAGCAQDPTPTTTGPPARPAFDPDALSQKRFEVLDPEPMPVAASTDGKMLENVVYRPDTDEKVPVFVNFSPYWGDTAMARGDPFSHYMVDEFVPRGYAVVLASVRGTGHSEGCFQIGGDIELQDAHDVVDFVAKQPWSNGNVAAGGKSYDSTTQNGMVAKVPHPALKGIFHVSGITSMYRYNYKDGVAYSQGPIFNTYYFQQGIHEYGLGGQLPPGGPGIVGGSPPDASSPMDEDQRSLARAIDDAACVEFPMMQASGVGSGAHGLKDAYWQERDWDRFLPDSSWNGSVFFVHGLQDWNVKPDHIDPWVEILHAKGIPVLGWLHQETENIGHVYPMRADWNETMLRWLDHTLKGQDTHMDSLWGFEVQGSDDVWRRSATWPPPATWWASNATSGAGEKAAGDAVFRVAGVPYANVTLMSGSADPIARIVLYDEAPSGTRKWVGEAVLRVQLNDALEAPRGYAPGTPVALTLQFFPLDHEVEPGHKLVWEAGADPSQAGSGTPADFFWTPSQVATVEYSSVEVFLPLADLNEDMAQPEPAPCFAC